MRKLRRWAKTSMNKYKVMGMRLPKHAFSVRNETLEEVNYHNYLGLMVSADRKHVREIR